MPRGSRLVKVQSVANTPTQILGASAKRVGVVLYTNPATVWNAYQDNTVSGTIGIPVANTPIEFWLDKHGSVVQGNWWGYDNGGGPMPFIVLEVYDN